MTISSNSTVASIGPGLRWIDVYQWIHQYNRVVVGARYAPVGVSGFLLGGGISFLSGQYGWGANSMLNYEVVTAEGKIIQVNKTSNSDLFWALKGGSSNFGIVTRFDLQTHPTGQIYGGLMTWNQSAIDGAVNSLAAFAAPGGGIDDPKAALLPNVAIDPASKSQSAAFFAFCNNADAIVLKNFTATASLNLAKVTTYADFIAGTAGGAAGNFRAAFHCGSFKASPQTVKLINDTVTLDAYSKLSDLEGVTISLSIQLLARSWFDAARKAGGDAIDMDPSAGSLIVLNLVVQWKNAADDKKIATWSDDILAKLSKESKKVGLGSEFIYLNDAQEGAKPFPTYGGGKSRTKLLNIRKRYDVNGVFQNLMPGGFKLGS
jgi:hypothetical protein